MKHFIGIDPGLRGAIAVIYKDNTIAYADAPVLGNEYDTSLLPGILQELVLDKDRPEEFMVILEASNARPSKGVKLGATTAFKMGFGFALWQVALAFTHIPFRIITPAKWKKDLNLSPDKKESLLLCKQLLPASREFLTLVKHDGRAEALLMAEYGRRLYTNQLKEDEA